MRALTAGERALLAGDHTIHDSLETVNALGAWINLSTLFGGSWVLDLEFGTTLDNGVGDATFTLALESVTPANGVVSLSPLVGTSPANNGGPALDYERPIRLRTAVTALGAARPADGDAAWRHVFLGKITGIETSGDSNQITVTALDEGSRLADAWVREDTEYSDEAGTLVETIMDRMRLDWAPWAPPIVVPQSPGWVITKFLQEKSSLLAALREKLALQIGWDFRYRWTGPTTFAPVFQAPERANPVVVASFPASEYLTIPRVGGTGEDLRNTGSLTYYDTALGEINTVTASDAASIARFGGPGIGERWFEIVLGEDSPIKTAVEAQRLIDAAISDLATPMVGVDVETTYFWPAEIGDYYAFGANGDRWTTEQQLAVVSIRHRLSGGTGRTTFGLRGRPSAAYRTWLDLPEGFGGVTTEPEPLRLVNFRVKTRTPTSVTFAWDDGILDTAADSIYVWLTTVPQGTSTTEVWPTAEQPPTTRLEPTTRTFTVPYPDLGNVTYAQFLPLRKTSLEPGDAERETINSTGAPPRFGATSSIVGESGLTATFALEIIDPQSLGGALRAWVNHDLPTDADPNGPADGTLDIVETPFTATGAQQFTVALGTQALLLNIRVQPLVGKDVYFEFINTRGISTGKVRFTLLGGAGIIDANGQIIDSGINNARQLAATLRPPRVYYDALPTDPISLGFVAGNQAVLVTAEYPTGRLFVWTGSEWKAVVNAVDLVGQLVEAQLADASVGIAKLAGTIAPVHKIANRSAPGQEGWHAITEDTHEFVRYEGGAWVDGVDASKITGQITQAQLAANSVGWQQLLDGAVTTAKHALASVTAAVIAAASIGATHITNDAITSPKIAASAIVAAHLSSGSVTAGAIAANTIAATHIQASAIDASKIQAGAIATIHLQAGAITTDTIAANAVTAVKVLAGAITAGKLAVGAVTAGTIAAGAIRANDILAGEIKATHIAVDSIYAYHIVAGQITATKLAADSVTSNAIAANAITSNKIAANAITAASIAAGAVTASAIQAGAVTAAHLTVSVLSGPGGVNGGSYVNLGTIVAGTLNGVSSGAYLDLNATGDAAFLYHPAIALYANGNGSLGANLSVYGAIFSERFYATRAYFEYSVVANTITDGVARGFYIKDTGAPPPDFPQYVARFEAAAGGMTTLYGRYGLELTTTSGSVTVWPALVLPTGVWISDGGTFSLGSGGGFGVFGAAPQTKRTVSGDRGVTFHAPTGKNHIPALDSLLQAFADLGFAVDLSSL